MTKNKTESRCNVAIWIWRFILLVHLSYTLLLLIVINYILIHFEFLIHFIAQSISIYWLLREAVINTNISEDIKNYHKAIIIWNLLELNGKIYSLWLIFIMKGIYFILYQLFWNYMAFSERILQFFSYRTVCF